MNRQHLLVDQYIRPDQLRGLMASVKIPRQICLNLINESNMVEGPEVASRQENEESVN